MEKRKRIGRIIALLSFILLIPIGIGYLGTSYKPVSPKDYYEIARAQIVLVSLLVTFVIGLGLALYDNTKR